MPVPSAQENRSFYSYILFVLITVLVLLKTDLVQSVIGLLTMLWGLLGFYRYIYLSSSQNKKIPKILTLPSRILFDLDQQHKKQIDLTIDRFLQTDVVMFFGGAVFLVLWGLYCSLNPLEIPLIQSYWEGKENILPHNNLAHYYPVLKQISYYCLVGVMIFIGLSYSHNSILFEKLNFIFLPIIGLTLIYILYFLPRSIVSGYLGFSHFNGIGWGQFDVFWQLNADNISQLKGANSGFLRRYIETGIIGAYAPYFIFLPVLFKFLKHYTHWANFVFIGLLVLLGVIDIFWVWHPYIHALQLFILSYVVCFWGALGLIKRKA